MTKPKNSRAHRIKSPDNIEAIARHFRAILESKTSMMPAEAMTVRPGRRPLARYVNAPMDAVLELVNKGLTIPEIIAALGPKENVFEDEGENE